MSDSAPYPTFTPLMKAAMVGDLSKVKEIVEPILAAEKAERAKGTPFWVGQVNELNNYNEDAITLALGHGNLDVVMYLLKIGAEPIWKNYITPLQQATFDRDFKRVKELVEAGAEIPTFDRGLGRTPLSIAANWGDIEVVKFLVQHGAKDDPYAGRNNSMWALLKGHIDCARFILKEALPPGLPDHSVIGAFAETGDVESFKILKERGLQLKLPQAIVATHAAGGDYGGSYSLPSKLALRIAAERGRNELIEYLLKEGVSPADGYALGEAAKNGQLRAVQLLAEHGSDLERAFGPSSAGDPDGIWGNPTPLNWAAGNNHLEIVKFLIKKGAQFDLSRSNNALETASLRGNLTIISFLLSVDSNPEHLKLSQATFNAAKNKHTKTVELFLKSGGTVEQALAGSIAGLDNENVQKYLHSVTDFNFYAPMGFTLASTALYYGNYEAIRLLKKAGYPMSKKNQDGRANLEILNGYTVTIPEDIRALLSP